MEEFTYEVKIKDLEEIPLRTNQEGASLLIQCYFDEIEAKKKITQIKRGRSISNDLLSIDVLKSSPKILAPNTGSVKTKVTGAGLLEVKLYNRRIQACNTSGRAKKIQSKAFIKLRRKK